MQYLISLMAASLILATAMHLRHQFRQTAVIRQHLHEARRRKIISGLHHLRKNTV